MKRISLSGKAPDGRYKPLLCLMGGVLTFTLTYGIFFAG